MAVDKSPFEVLKPSRFLVFAARDAILPSQFLRIAVLDSPVHCNGPPTVAVLFVPQNLESDWRFCTESGHLQLLLSSRSFSRVILIGRFPFTTLDRKHVIRHANYREGRYIESLRNTIIPIFNIFLPKTCANGPFDMPVLEYEDDVICSVVLKTCTGRFVGEMVVEDAELQNCGHREYRRRLRFKRMPNLIQSEVRIIPERGDSFLDQTTIGGMGFRPDNNSLVHSYLVPMIACLSVIADYIDEKTQSGRIKPTALCLGVGGGALLGFLRTRLGFDVLGVEIDETVVRIAKRYFGLEDHGCNLFVDDSLRFMKRLARDHDLLNSNASKFDVIMIDIDSYDCTNGISAPPSEFLDEHALRITRSILSPLGIVVLNLMLLDGSLRETVICKLQRVFYELYELDVGNGENFVLAVTTTIQTTPLITKRGSVFLRKLEEAINGKYMCSIRKV